MIKFLDDISSMQSVQDQFGEYIGSDTELEHCRPYILNNNNQSKSTYFTTTRNFITNYNSMQYHFFSHVFIVSDFTDIITIDEEYLLTEEDYHDCTEEELKSMQEDEDIYYVYKSFSNVCKVMSEDTDCDIHIFEFLENYDIYELASSDTDTVPTFGLYFIKMDNFFADMDSLDEAFKYLTHILETVVKQELPHPPEIAIYDAKAKAIYPAIPRPQLKLLKQAGIPLAYNNILTYKRTKWYILLAMDSSKDTSDNKSLTSIYTLSTKLPIKLMNTIAAQPNANKTKISPSLSFTNLKSQVQGFLSDPFSNN